MSQTLRYNPDELKGRTNKKIKLPHKNGLSYI